MSEPINIGCWGLPSDEEMQADGLYRICQALMQAKLGAAAPMTNEESEHRRAYLRRRLRGWREPTSKWDEAVRDMVVVAYKESYNPVDDWLSKVAPDWAWHGLQSVWRRGDVVRVWEADECAQWAAYTVNGWKIVGGSAETAEAAMRMADEWLMTHGWTLTPATSKETP